MTEIRVPSVGESVAEVRVGRWLKSPGDSVAKDEDLVELETDKASVVLPAPEAGVLAEVLKPSGESAKVGEVLGRLKEVSKTDAPPEAPRPAPKTEEPRPAPPPTAAPRAPERPGEGNGSRGKTLVTGRAASAPAAPPEPSSREEIVPMSPLRRAAAERLVAAQREAALLTTFNEIDLGAVQETRLRYRPLFEERHGVKLGLMSFFLRATVEALKRTPELNAMVRGHDIVHRRHYDLGVAVSGPKGLVVPVIRDADRLGFVDLERAVGDFARRAAENRIRPQDLAGGTFSITNGGIFGSLLSTPIVNPPQSGILGMHAILDRPVARNGRVVIRPMMYVALTYDHRLVDGREAVGFLKRVKEAVEDPVSMLLGI